MTAALSAFLGALAMGVVLLIVVAYLQRELREQTRALREQIGDERVAALRDQNLMLEVARTSSDPEIAWRMLDAVTRPVVNELARKMLSERA